MRFLHTPNVYFSLALLFLGAPWWAACECANIQLKFCQCISTSQLVNPFLSISVILRVDACIDGHMDLLGVCLFFQFSQIGFVDTVTLPVVVRTAFEARETSKAGWWTLVQGREATPR